MDDDKEPKFWVTALKLVLGAIFLIVFFGLGLYFSAKYKTYAPEGPPPDTSWGISKDSPIRSNR